jgi:hypothetical protein
MARFACRDPQAVMAPLDVVQSQRGYFASPEPIGDEQEQDRVIPSAQDGLTINAVQQFLHILGRDRSGQMREPIVGGSLHDPAKIASDEPFAVQIAQKHTEHSAPNPQRGALKALTSLGQKLAHHGRRKLVQIFTPQIGQISGECAEMFVVQL